MAKQKEIKFRDRGYVLEGRRGNLTFAIYNDNTDPVFVIEDNGPDTFLDDMGATITGRQAKPEEERRDLPVAFVPHRRTCPWADKPAQRRVERGGSYGGLSPAVGIPPRPVGRTKTNR